MAFDPTILCELYLTATLRFATRELYVSDVLYLDGLSLSLDLTERLTDLYYGVEEASSVQFSIGNKDGYWDTVVASEELRGAWVLLKTHNPDDGAAFAFRGKITGYTLGESIDITCDMRDDVVLETELPRHTITTDDFDVSALDVGQAVNLCFGYCYQVPCGHILEDTTNNYYDYLIGYGPIESLDAVYRDGVQVTTTEYTLLNNTTYAGYAAIRFLRQQVDHSGGHYTITADVKGLLMGEASANRNFARTIQYMLSDTAWGLSDNVDTASFASAITALADYDCDGAVIGKRPAGDIIDDLLFCVNGIISRGADG
ncbi:MAG: hypothetical protein ABIK68_05285, partial [bacterium]